MDTILKVGVVSLLCALVTTLPVLMYLITTRELPQNDMCELYITRRFQCEPQKDLKEGLSEMLDRREIIRRTEEYRTQETLYMQKPFLKLIGTELINEKNERGGVSGMTIITDWQYDKDMFENNEISSNIKYTSGYMTVPDKGHYFVHSSIELVVPPHLVSGMDFTVQIKHSIFRTCILGKEDLEITSNIQTYLVTDNESLYIGRSQVSSLVKMEARDKISIRLSNITFFHNSKNNEFAVRLV
ncbi:uncharacterized protein LOC132741681 [Ruditapes philippinarum]|uniref:uncharacterized protein LOC132741681 n=1 Tax=Ruditapes philippinarum TaxID=129788 RepID=UPI00295B7F72|nr:uncharacterized protein LOC132741681 [Ruditapes philippinarum]